MPTVKITNERLYLFVLAGKAYTSGTPLSKLWYAVDKITKIAEKKLKIVDKEKNNKRRELGLKKEKGIYDLDDKGNFQFDDKSWTKLVEQLDIIDETETELPTHIIPHGEYDDSKLSFDTRNIFEGIVIPAIDYETFDIDSFTPPKPADEKK